MPGEAVLVVGPESTGTRLVTEVMVRAGCHGSAEHQQPWDVQPPDGVSPVVWRRSVPHAQAWPDLEAMVAALTDRGYAVRAVVTCRAWWPTVHSQVAAGHVRSVSEAVEHLRVAYPFIFRQLAATPYQVVPYEALVLHGAQHLAPQM